MSFVGFFPAKNPQLTILVILDNPQKICALKIGRLIKNKKFHQYILDFGFGEKTNIELPGEIKGVVHNYTKWSNLDKAVISYGHSISVTPIQLISAINAIEKWWNVLFLLLLSVRIFSKCTQILGISCSKYPGSSFLCHTFYATSLGYERVRCFLTNHSFFFLFW